MTRRRSADAPFEVLLWGATSSTGKVVAEYLARHYGVARDLRWAIGGRNREKLEQVRAELLPFDPAAGQLPILIGDARDEASLDGIVTQARVVATTVGPYAVYGRELVAACARHGVDYCDLTGEVPFMRDMIDAHDATARETGARIVPACGFDSIPSDLGVLMLQEHMREKHGARCTEVKCFLTDVSGEVGGGTAATLINLVEEGARDARVRRLLGNPYALEPGRTERGPDRRDQRGVRWDPDLPGWTAHYIMAGTNTRVVRRTNALLGYAWGKDFRYSEVVGFRPGLIGWLLAQGLTLGMAAMLAPLVIPPLRAVLKRTVIPAPGEGPSRETRERGHFTFTLVGLGEPDREGRRVRLRGTVIGASDPGHGETAKMLAESAICLARDDDATRGPGGLLTPASSMGVRLLERLRRAGMTFTVEEDPRDSH